MYLMLGTIVLNFQYIFSNRHFNCLFACPNTFGKHNKTFYDFMVFFKKQMPYLPFCAIIDEPMRRK